MKTESVFLKFTVTLLLVMALMATQVFAYPDFDDCCKDVSKMHWAYTTIKKAYECGVVKGYPDKSFRPDQAVTPAEFFKMAMVAAFGTDPGSATEGHWCSNYEKLLYESIPEDGKPDMIEKGIMFDSVTDMIYQNTSLKREDAAMIAGLALYIKEGPKSVESLKDVNMRLYIDTTKGPTNEKIKIAVKSGLMVGSWENGILMFKPFDKLTRAEAVTIISRLLDADNRLNTAHMFDIGVKGDRPCEQQEQETVTDTVKKTVADILKYTNEERKAEGLKGLALNTKLTEVAMLKAKDLAENDYFAHDSPVYGSPFDMMEHFGISFGAAGENIAMGYASAKAVVDGWMNSPGHRANILLDKFTDIGIGVYYNDKGTPLYVQMFISKR